MAEYTTEEQKMIVKAEEDMLYESHPCSTCLGEGINPPPSWLTPSRCPTCKGEGVLRRSRRPPTHG